MPIDRTWILSDRGLPIEADAWAKRTGEDLATRDNDLKEMSTNQLRRFFGNLKRLQAMGFSEQNASKLLRLKPLLAYAVGRDKKNGRQTTKIARFYHDLSGAIDYVLEATELMAKSTNHDANKKQVFISQYFTNFVNIVEAIVAYHKFKGGSEA